MAKGGYTIIDFKGANITAAGEKMPGVYDRVERCIMNKPILVTNFAITGKEMIPQFCSVFFEGNAALLTLYDRAGVTQTISVKDDDTVGIRVFQ